MALVIAGLTLAGEGAGAFIAADHFETRPGYHMYLFQDDALWRSGVLSARRRATADCVTAPCALEISFPPADGPPGVIAFDTNHALQRGGERPLVPADIVGMSLFFKGDGSDGFARIEMRGDYRRPGAAVELPLSDEKWKHVLVKWSDFKPEGDVAEAAAICFGLKEGSSRPAHYTIDALQFVTSTFVDGEFAALADEANAGGDIEIPRRPSPGACTYNKGGLAKARAKLRAGKPLKWLAYGDSVTVPVQMWNIPEELIRGCAYYSVAARALEREFSSKIEVVVNAVGGRQLSENFQSLLDSLESEKPDVLVMLTGDTIRNYELFMPRAVKAAVEAGTEVLVVVPTYDSVPYRCPEFDWLRRYAIENGLACADARRYLLDMPDCFWGDNVANDAHPNPEGHRLIGEVVAEMFR